MSDFGRNGEPPTHPELLEWLARDFVAHGWKLKRLHRMILTSSVYLQDKSSDVVKAKSDPENRLLSRRRPQRIESEILRDSILAISGLLNLDPFGPAFKPPISSEAMVARNVKSPYPTDIRESAATRRRSIYLFHKRVIPYPLMQAFDAPDAQQSCGRRNGTTVAPQALVLLNDQFIRDSALAFADRLSREASRSANAIVDRAYELALGRQPRDSERAASLRFLESQGEARRTRDPNKSPEHAQRSSLADFCQSLFSLNEFVYVD